MSDMELYWRVPDQIKRLQELTTADPELKEQPLRRDVRSLGNLLGTAIREQAGEKVYALEESLRHLSFRPRRQNCSKACGPWLSSSRSFRFVRSAAT